MSLGGGDQLARGAVSAVFKLCPNISQEEWDERVGKRPEKSKKNDHKRTDKKPSPKS